MRSEAELVDWLIGPDAAELGLATLLEETILSLSGLIWYCRINVRTAYSSSSGTRVVWRRDVGVLEQVRTHSCNGMAELGASVQDVLRRELFLRVSLCVDPIDDIRFPLGRELAAEGATELVFFPLWFRGQVQNSLFFVTKAKGGFSGSQVGTLQGVVRALTARLEATCAYSVAEGLLERVLGPTAAEQVLRIGIQQSGCLEREKALWFAHLRGFQRLGDTQPVEEVIESLNAYFECISRPVWKNQGEIIYFGGELIMAAFSGCTDALDAAQEALLEAKRLSFDRARYNLMSVDLEVALHFGVVAFGNLSALDRVQPGVFGTVVNEGRRMCTLFKKLEKSLLISEAFARDVVLNELLPLGKFILSEGNKQQVFTLVDLDEDLSDQ